MRTLTRRPAAALDDDALLKRRRTIEVGGLVARSAGLVLTAMTAAGASAAPVALTTADMRSAYLLGVAAMIVANGLAVLALRRPASRWYKPFSVGQIVLDTATILSVVVLSSQQSSQVTWPLLIVAIAVASLRLQLLGALLVFAACSLGFALGVPGSPDVSFMISVGFITAVVTGTQSSSLNRQLTALTETRRALQYQAAHDMLTGLPNRANLAGYAEQHTGRALGVLLLDLNGFKQVNDTYGHAAGDRLLHEIGGRLTVALSGEGLAGRIGGDEFLVLLPEADRARSERVVARIRDAVRRPIDLGGGEVTVGVSAGLAVRPAGGDAGLEELYAQADVAMYRDKRSRSHAA